MWKKIEGWPYEVSDKGEVRRGTKVLLCNVAVNGYVRVTLCHNNAQQQFYVHKLVLLAFTGPPPINMECRHLDGDKLNNNRGNLCWGTHVQNCEDRDRHGRDTRGEKGGMSKLCRWEIPRIQKLLAKGMLYKHIAAKFNVSISTIGRIKQRGGWGVKY